MSILKVLDGLTPKELEELEQAIKEKQKANAFKPKTFKDYTDEEIKENFKKLLNYAREYYDAAVGCSKNKKEKNFILENAEKYTFEGVVNLLGKGVWEAINVIGKKS